MSDLKSLSEIFQQRLIRIPDYQRGYAWQIHELNDFWEDLFHLVDDKAHYTGVITLEPVDQPIYKRWNDDLWLIEDLGYKPFYVVDGQQRLTTAMILIQTIIEFVGNDAVLNSQTIENIRQKYVMVKGADDGLQRSFLFGYEKDNPSDEFLRTNIFMEYSATNRNEQTLYTRNLDYAKTFFAKKLGALESEDIAKIFKKITLKFKFNLYKIDAEYDVFVVFETMNNRGKKLSNLELLKNRLIYLSTLFENKGHEVLRSKINESWKTIYEYLGKNPKAPLSEDDFLHNHWRMYFKYSGKKDNEYKDFLLDGKFTAQNVNHPADEEQRITIKEVEEYVTSLQKAIKHWFYMHNPSYMPLAGYDDDNKRLLEENKRLLDRLVRLNFRSFKPLILAAYCRDRPFCEINELLVAAERCNFTIFTLRKRRSDMGNSEFFRLAEALFRGDIKIDGIDGVVDIINRWVEDNYSAVDFGKHIEELYEDRNKTGRVGFYGWRALQYFLYEHEDYLRQRGKQSTEEIDWKKLTAAKKDHVTVEHVYPQTKTGDWADAFSGYSNKEKRFLTHSLGNLLPLSRSKNSSLQNKSFDLKKNNGAGVGYYNGSVSENELAQYDKWTSEGILKRGLELLEFMEERWDIKLVDEDFKKEKILCLGFL